MREEDPQSILILKTCIGGAFFNKYVKAAYKNDDMLSKMHQTQLFQGEEAKRSIILNKVSEHISDGHLKQYFENKFKVPVESVKISVDKPTIIFGNEILDRGFIKACFKLGLRSRVSRYRKLQDNELEEENKFKSRIFTEERRVSNDAVFSYDEVRDMLENEELRRPCYLYELRFETMNKEAFVEFDRDSINNFTYELDERMLKHVTYACQDYYDKGGRFICRNSTRLPSVPMVDVLFCLLFAPKVAVRADYKQLYFNRIICDDGETQIKLTHILTHQDLQIVQKIRTMMNESLCNEDHLKQAHLTQVDFYIKRLFSFNRLPVQVFDKLMMFREEDGETIPGKTSSKEKPDDIDKFMEGEANFFMDDKGGLLDLTMKEGEGYDEVAAVSNLQPVDDED